MPCLEITMPRIDHATKARLASELTAAFAEATGFEPEIFGISFREYEPGEAAHGGKLWDGSGVPHLHFLLYIPRISRAAKQRVAAGFTGVFGACLGKPDWVPVIHIDEHPYDNVGVDGRILSELHPPLEKLAFYYPLTDREA
jgi:4-oxalocrotonate tautomerase